MSTRHSRFVAARPMAAAVVLLLSAGCNSIAGLGDLQFGTGGSSSTATGSGGSSSTATGSGGQGGQPVVPAKCSNEVLDDKETDVDCGGPSCLGCAVGKKCLATSDCKSGEGCDVNTKICDKDTCKDGLSNGSETDIDCGGSTCPSCAIGQKCSANGDCASGSGCDVITKTCDGNLCQDGIKNGNETDVDCGGGTCSECALNKKCLVNSDCLAGNGCDVTTKTCNANLCHDGLKNGNETDLDCGGVTCSRCGFGKKCLVSADCVVGDGCDVSTKLCDASQCHDGQKNGSETDVDCGGGACGACGLGSACLSTTDCPPEGGCDVTTKTCDGNACNDGQQNSGETDVDCGGGVCAPCALDKKCRANSDCLPGQGCDVTTKRCDANKCHDGLKDGAESDIDCGGNTCSPCAVGKACVGTVDCLPGDGCDVTTKTCDADTCNDGLENGGESDIDCGGTCTRCAVGKACVSNNDCQPGGGCDVTTHNCASNFCHDGVKNGSETAVDCGGATCAPCAIDQACVSSSDCVSGNCHVGTCAPVCVSQTFTALGAVQTFTLPLTGTYSVEATGAQGGADSLGGGAGGLGARMQGNFPLMAGNALQIVVGARPAGTTGNQDGGGGGGGTFVFVNPTPATPPGLSPLLVAGGGGGGGGGGGVITTGNGAGGPAGNNGGSSGGAGGGGEGWLSPGASNGGGGGGTLMRWAGGPGISTGGNLGSNGGFGGGGGAAVFNRGVGGGGGGYTGGSGGNVVSAGGPAGGGSSFMNASVIGGTTTQTPSFQAGSGYVKIIGPLAATCP